jgi:hypothetical protein
VRSTPSDGKSRGSVRLSIRIVIRTASTGASGIVAKAKDLNSFGTPRENRLSRGTYLKMFTARAVTSRMLTAEMADSDNISSFAQRLNGIASVGLNAIEFVNDT